MNSSSQIESYIGVFCLGMQQQGALIKIQKTR